MKIIPLNQQDASDLLALICNDSLAIKSNAAPRVHALQALLSSEPEECTCLAAATVAELEAELARRSAPT